jgi:hypothetical protein
MVGRIHVDSTWIDRWLGAGGSHSVFDELSTTCICSHYLTPKRLRTWITQKFMKKVHIYLILHLVVGVRRIDRESTLIRSVYPKHGTFGVWSLVCNKHGRFTKMNVKCVFNTAIYDRWLNIHDLLDRTFESPAIRHLTYVPVSHPIQNSNLTGLISLYLLNNY